jgi:hypothetical protein
VRVLIAAWLALSMPGLCLAQPPPPVDVEVGSGWDKADPRSAHPKHKSAHERAKKAEAYSLRVRYVKVEGRWVGDIPLPIAAGDVLTPAKIFDALEALERAITANSINGYGLRSKGEIGVLYIDVDYDTSTPAVDAAGVRPAGDTVGVIFRPHYIQVSLERIGDNVLPIPRSPRPTFFENVPKPLLALKPVFGVSQDRAFGTALGGAIQADLFNLRDPARISTATDENQHLDVHAQGMKSVDESFYRVDAGLRYSQRLTGRLWQGFTLGADYDGIKEPLGATEHTRNAGLLSGGVTLKLAPSTRLSLDTGYRRTDDAFSEPGSRARTSTSTDEQTNRALLDAMPPPIYGFLRAAVWEDNGWLSGGGSYQRMVGRIGYAKEIPVQPNQTIGLEVVAGGGAVLGNPPGYAHFFGGNSSGQFLYDSPSSAALQNMPVGPLIRSFGEGRAGLPTARGVRGGEGFWHVNVNLTIPIRWWSRALIPSELTDIEDADGKPVSLKQLLRKQVDVTGPSMLAATLKKEGMSAEEAEKKAREILGEVRPATHFIIDDANIYSVKPLLMFDAAGLTERGLSSGETWLAAGGGLEVTIVIAKLQVGYMRTLSGPTFGSRGNVFVRLVFQNLF